MSDTPAGGGIIAMEEVSEEVNGIQLPCKSLPEFDIFEETLQNDTAFRKRMVKFDKYFEKFFKLSFIAALAIKRNFSVLQSKKILKSIDKDQDMTRCLGTCIRLFMSQAIGVLFVPVKPTDKKRVFKGTTLCKMLEGNSMDILIYLTLIIFCIPISTKQSPVFGIT